MEAQQNVTHGRGRLLSQMVVGMEWSPSSRSDQIGLAAQWEDNSVTLLISRLLRKGDLVCVLEDTLKNFWCVGRAAYGIISDS